MSLPYTLLDADHFPFTAAYGYVYWYQGRQYSQEEAEEATAQLGSIDGWRWLRHDPTS